MTPAAKNVAIMMAIGGLDDKIPYLSNVLYSIKKQNGLADYNIKLCFFLDGNNEDKTNRVDQVARAFFNPEQILYSSSDNPVGFQYLPSYLAKMTPDETDIIVFQSSDIIWYDKNILTTMVEEVEKENSAFSCRIANFVVDGDLFKKGDEFHRELASILGNRSLQSHVKKLSKYMYLAAMRPEVFRGFGAEPFVCDVIQQHWLRDNGIQICELKNLAIHQHHRHIRYDCSSLPICPDRYRCIRKTK